MNNSRISGSIVLGLALAGAAAVAGFQSGATATSANMDAKAAVIGTVDLNVVMKDLAEVQERNAALVVSGKARQEELTKAREELKKIQHDIDQADRNSKDRINKIAQGIELQKTTEAKAQIFQQLINLEKGEILRDVYRKIEEAAKNIGEKEGFDLIIVDDRSMVAIPDRGSDQEVSMAAQSRKVLYAGKSVDLTSRVITVLNTQYGAPKK